MPIWQAGQRELRELHAYTYEIDVCSLAAKKESLSAAHHRVHAVNEALTAHVHASTNRTDDYHRFLSTAQFRSSKTHAAFLRGFMSASFFDVYCGLGFSQINTQEKDVTSLTRTALYSVELMGRQSWRQEHEFEKECINQMARSTLKSHTGAFGREAQSLEQGYSVQIRIGHGYTYSKYCSAHQPVPHTGVASS